jgi:hypothetical protein
MTPPNSGEPRHALSQGVLEELRQCAEALENTTRVRFSAMDSQSRVETLMKEQQNAVLAIVSRLRTICA